MIIRNIWCAGRNYADHAKELGNDVPKQPIIFLKAGSSASINSNEIILPWWTEEVHHEVELALKFSNYLHINEGALALDLTERKLQAEAKKNGTPWTLAKSFDGATAISSFFQIKKLQDFADSRIRLWVNDDLKQDGRTSEMIFKMEDLIQYVKERFPVCAGDFLLTGTPMGVGPIKDGDIIRVELENGIGANAEKIMTHQWKVIKAKKEENEKS